MTDPTPPFEIPLHGHSMWPFLHPGDSLLVESFSSPQKMNQFEEGEILLAREQQEWVAHRLIQYKGRKVLKGDFSNRYTYDDQPLIWGRVIGVSYTRGHRRWSQRHRGAQAAARLSARVLETQHSRKGMKFGLYLWLKMARIFS